MSRFELSAMNDSVRLLAIDPGTDTLGVSVLEIDFKSGNIDVIAAKTFNAGKMLRLNEKLKEEALLRGDRYSRLKIHEANLYTFLTLMKPTFVASEAPFMGKRMANAYEALLECLMAIRNAVYKYDDSILIDMISPTSAKKAVGVTGRGKTKDDVADGVIKLIKDKGNNVTYSYNVPLTKLDEHSIDSIAVGIYAAKTLIAYHGGV